MMVVQEGDILTYDGAELISALRGYIDMFSDFGKKEELRKAFMILISCG